MTEMNTAEKLVTLKVSNNTRTIPLRSSIIGNLRSGSIVFIDAIGANPNYIVLKAIIMARGIFLSMGAEMEVTPSFHDVLIDEPIDSEIAVKTAVRWKLSIK